MHSLMTRTNGSESFMNQFSSTCTDPCISLPSASGLKYHVDIKQNTVHEENEEDTHTLQRMASILKEVRGCDLKVCRMNVK